MKLKSNVIIGIVVASFFLGGITLHAQGLYSEDDQTVNTTTTTPSAMGGGLFRADPNDPFDNGSGGGDPGQGSTPDPIGGGFVILSLLSGAYAVIKRNIRNKHED